MFRKIALMAAVIAVVVGCSDGGYSDRTASNGAPADNVAGGKREAARYTNPNDGGTLAATSTSTPTSVADRKVVRAASLQVRVQNIDQAEKQVDAAIKSAGGYLEKVSSDDLASSNAVLSIQAKVPVDKFDDTIAKLEGFGTRLSKSVSMQDVTDPILTLDATVKELRMEEDEIHSANARRQADDSSGRLSDIKARIAAAQALRDQQAKAAAFATVNLTLKQGAVPGNMHDPNWLAQAYGSASTAAGEAFRMLATFFLWLMFFSPFYVPVGVVLWLANRARRRKTSLAGAGPGDMGSM